MNMKLDKSDKLALTLPIVGGVVSYALGEPAPVAVFAIMELWGVDYTI